MRVMQDIIQKTLNMSYEDLIIDIGFESQADTSEFFTELGNCLIGKTPSRREQ